MKAETSRQDHSVTRLRESHGVFPSVLILAFKRLSLVECSSALLTKTKGVVMRLRIFASIAGFCAAPHLAAQAQPVTQNYPVVQGTAYKFEQIADRVYYATGTAPGLGSNNVVIVNDTDVLIVDTGTSPAAARAFVEDIKKLTDKPIRYAVNTHWHYDHTAGNQIFGPEVQIIATDYLYQMLATVDVLHREPFLTSQVTGLSARIDNLNRQIAAEGDAQQKAALQKDLADAQRLQQQNSEIKVDELVAKLKAVADAHGGTEARIYVRGDKKVHYGTMMRVMGRLSAAGFHRVALVTEIEQGGAAGTGPPGSDTSATITMIVPDGVAEVTLQYPAGRASGYSPKISPPFTVTSAPGTTDPEGSLTVPVMVPAPVVCAEAIPASSVSKATLIASFLNRFDCRFVMHDSL